jgi:hypothetical protein
MAASAHAAGEPSIAKAVDVRPEATGLYNGATIVLSAQDDLYEGQKITTGAQGQVQIVFADDTRMVVGPGSSLVIEKYLMRNGLAVRRERARRHLPLHHRQERQDCLQD